MSRFRTIRRHALQRDEDQVELCLVRKEGIFGGFNVQESGKGPTRMLSWRWTRESEAAGILMARMRTLQSLGFAADHPGTEGAEAAEAPAPASEEHVEPKSVDWTHAVNQAVQGELETLREAMTKLDEAALASAVGLETLALSTEPSRSTAARLAAVLPACLDHDQAWVSTWLRSRSVLMQVAPDTIAGWLASPGPWAKAMAHAVTTHGPALLGPALRAVPESTDSSVVAEAATHWLARMEQA